LLLDSLPVCVKLSSASGLCIPAALDAAIIPVTLQQYA
jgi:hypothetical protein